MPVCIVFGMDTEDFAYRDALRGGPAHRRGAGLNPGNRFEDIRLHVLGEELDRRRYRDTEIIFMRAE